MKQKLLEVSKNVLFGVGTALSTAAGLGILITVAGFNPETVAEVLVGVITGTAFYFVGKTVREKFFKDS